MPLPANFQFSQGSLQDFLDCRRRFYLRYIRKLSWPAAQSEPMLENERAMLDGAFFHRMVQQYLLGLPQERLTKMALGTGLRIWWENFLASKSSLVGVDTPGYIRRVEYSLTIPLDKYNLVAKYDLLAAGMKGPPSQRSFWLYDWKTSRVRSRRSTLAERLQTRVYPYILTGAGELLNNGTPIHPDQVEMVYWFTGFPDDPEHFHYSQHQYDLDGQDLTALIETILRLTGPAEEAGFPLTGNEKMCTYCVYRSLCSRGQRAGEDKDMQNEVSTAEQEFDLDFDQVAEVEF